MCAKKGFSLIELSISIIIIGLLVAGITSGSKLIQQAELRAVIADLEQYKKDYFTFLDIYGVPPGDFRNASTVFAGCATGGVGNLNCNGNGDGKISFNMGNAYDGDALGDETGKVHRHLNLSGINGRGGNTALPQNYDCISLTGDVALGYYPKGTGLNSTIQVVTTDDGTVTTAMALGTIWANGTPTYQTSNFANGTTIIGMLKANSGPTNYAGILTPINAHGIDRKIDDGTYSGANATGANTGNFRVVTDITGGSACVAGANYTLATTTTTCVPQLLIK